jgi:hypothetical protein
MKLFSGALSLFFFLIKSNFIFLAAYYECLDFNLMKRKIKSPISSKFTVVNVEAQQNCDFEVVDA